MSLKKVLFSFLIFCLATNNIQGTELVLNGDWETGINRKYTHYTSVPGIATNDTQHPSAGSVWFRKEIKLPDGSWSNATLILKSALYCPKIYIDGERTGDATGGMMNNTFLLNHPNIRPGEKVAIEIELASLNDVPETDPARPSQADLWRSCQASWIRDDVILELHNELYISKLIPFTSADNQSVNIHWEIINSKQGCTPKKLKFEIIDQKEKTLLTETVNSETLNGSVFLDFNGKLQLWTPHDPNVYKIRLTAFGEKGISQRKTINYSPKSFTISEDNSQFLLNGNPCTLRGGSIVWNRFAREPEAKELIDDREWFYRAVIKPFKDHGANFLRFHLYPPPEWALDLCDKHGLLVQLEVQYFHAIGGSSGTRPGYYSKLLTMASQHPSTAIIQLYNETDPELEKRMYDSYLEIENEFPRYVIANINTYNLHRYWWSMSENVALYANSWKEFDRPTIIDEFGANYMDENWEISSYPRAKPGFDRFLNTGHTPETRMKLQDWSYGKIGEYWRRIGIQGIAPFCTLGPFEDGGNWYVGALKEANLKPLWSSLAPVYAPRSLSMEIWDRNFEANEDVIVPIYLFNEMNVPDSLFMQIRIVSETGETTWKTEAKSWLNAFDRSVIKVPVKLPAEAGAYQIEAELLNPAPMANVPVISSWDIHVHDITIPAELKGKIIGIPDYESELFELFAGLGIKTVSYNSKKADVIVTSHRTWNALFKGDSALTHSLDLIIENGKHLVMLDIGPKFHGDKCMNPAALYDTEGNEYPADIIQKGIDPKEILIMGRQDFTNNFKAAREKDIWTGTLPGGMKIRLNYAFEPESHFHPTQKGRYLWNHLDLDQTWLWNGLRGGLNVSAIDISIDNIDQSGFLYIWGKRGADTDKIIQGPYYAYELEGYYGFSEKKDDLEVLQDLYHQVHFVVEDLVSLKGLLDPDSEAKIVNLTDVFNSLEKSSMEVVSLATAGHGLNKSPVIMAKYHNQSRLIVSNLFTAGRLTRRNKKDGLYEYRYDPATVQFVLNLIAFPWSSPIQALKE